MLYDACWARRKAETMVMTGGGQRRSDIRVGRLGGKRSGADLEGGVEVMWMPGVGSMHRGLDGGRQRTVAEGMVVVEVAVVVVVVVVMQDTGGYSEFVLRPVTLR